MIQIKQGFVEFEIIGDRIEAAGSAEMLDGVEKDPIEAHLRGALEMRSPFTEGAGQQREDVIKNHRTNSAKSAP